MPSLSPSIEQALHHAIKLASDRHHEYATLEHLLLALMDDTDASQVMKACNVDMDALRKSVQKYIDEDLSALVMDESEEAKPTTRVERSSSKYFCTDLRSASMSTLQAFITWLASVSSISASSRCSSVAYS